MRWAIALPAVFWTLAGAACCGIPAWTLSRRANRNLGVFLLVPYAFLLLLPRPAWWLGNAALLLAVAGGALLIGRSLPTRGSLIAFLVVAGVVDLLSFGDGLTRAIIDGYRTGESDLLLRLALLAPLQGRIVPVVGISDLLIAASSAVALRGLGFGAGRVAFALAAGLWTAVIVGVVANGAAALPFLAVAVGVLITRAGSSAGPGSPVNASGQ